MHEDAGLQRVNKSEKSSNEFWNRVFTPKIGYLKNA